ncbi:MAG: hypothetical protein ACLRRT_10785, partial [Ruthenibacterium lactatiformans]
LTEEPSTPDASSMPYTASQSQAAGIPDNGTVPGATSETAPSDAGTADSAASEAPGSDTAQREETGSVPAADIEEGEAGMPDASPDSDETEKNTANATESPVDAGEEEDGAPRAALMPLDMPSAITGELAMLLATNQADSIMGSLGLARSDECRTVQAVLAGRLQWKDTLDENYAALWAALEVELSALSAQGADSAGCSYADGAIPLGVTARFVAFAQGRTPNFVGYGDSMCRCVVALW